MLFQSCAFIIFLIIVFLIYWNLPQRFRWILLLAAGYLYYAGFDSRYLLLLLGITLLSYCAGIILALPALTGRPYIRKTAFLFFALCELTLLLYFKIPKDSIILPVGISFYTFQTLAYIIDIYMEKTVPEKQFGYFATSVAFFPILLSGPIERIPGLTAQLKADKTFTEEDGAFAVRHMLLGYFKKMIIADSLAAYVDSVYGNLTAHTGFALLLTILLYSVQIYCDFSGYSDIAIGVARLLGIRLTENFRLPYFASSIKDFWKRWHISLTSWFRDYVYIPLGGNRTSKIKIYRNIMATFLLSGLWHGMGLSFLVWGGLHGLLQILESIFRDKIKIPAAVRRVCVYLLVSLAWVFFRADTVSNALYVICHSLDGLLAPVSYIRAGYAALNMPLAQLILLLFFLFCLALHDYAAEKDRRLPEKLCRNRFKIPLLLAFTELALFYFLKYGTDSSAFIYFQF